MVPILFMVGVLGAKVEGNLGLDLALALGKAALTIAGIYAIGRLILRPALRIAAQTRSPEMLMAAILLTVIGISAITGAAGLSMALGAFLAGLLLAETEYRHTVEVDIEPFKGLMLGLFFMSVGMGIDWRVIAQEPLWIGAAVLGLFALKALVTTGLCLAFGLGRATAVETGLLLGQGGEFAFIVVGLAMGLDVIAPDIGQFMLIVAGLTMLATPLVAVGAERLATWMETGATDAAAHAVEAMGDIEGHVILAGFGRVGRTLVETLQAEAIPFVAIDADAASVAAARQEKDCRSTTASAARSKVLSAPISSAASAVVLTMDKPHARPSRSPRPSATPGR